MSVETWAMVFMGVASTVYQMWCSGGAQATSDGVGSPRAAPSLAALHAPTYRGVTPQVAQAHVPREDRIP